MVYRRIRQARYCCWAIILFISGCAYADETTYQYFVWVPSFTDIATLQTAMTDKGKTKDAQPFKKTSIASAVNTDYATVSINPSSKEEKDSMDNYEKAGSLKLYRTVTLSFDANTRDGWHVDIQEINPLPDEFYKVKKSS